MLPWLQRHNIIKSLGIISRSTEDRLGRAVAAVDLSVVWRRCVAARTRRQAEVPVNSPCSQICGFINVLVLLAPMADLRRGACPPRCQR